MSEQPKIGPCPVCGAVAQYPIVEWRSNDEFTWLNCTCGMETTACRTKLEAVTIWNRLSQGAQLLAAVEELSHRLDSRVGRSLLIWKIQYGDTWELEVSISDGAFVRGSATLPAALISLAGKEQP